MLAHTGIFALMAAHKAAILAEGVRQAAPMAPGGTPTVEMLKSSVFGYAREVAKGWLLPGAVELLQGAVSTYHTQMGPRPQTDINDPDNIAWCDAFDEHIMDAMGVERVRDVGQDFIGEHVTGSEIDTPDTLTRVAQIMVDNLVEAAVKARSHGQVLAEIGIVSEDLAPHAAPQTAEQAKTAAVADRVIGEPEARARVERVVGMFAIKAGIAAFDAAALGETLKLCFDDEEFLALGPIEAMGGTRDDVPFFMAYHKASPTCIADTVNAAMMAAMTGAVVEPPKDVKVPKAKKLTKKQIAEQEKAAVAPNAVAPPPVQTATSDLSKPAGVDYSPAIKALREMRLATDEDLGTMIGQSRGTVNNIVKKDRACSLDSTQRAGLIKAVQERIAGLQNALTLLA